MREKENSIPAQASLVEAFLREAGSGQETTKEVDRRIKLVKHDSERQVVMESRGG